MVVVRKWGEDHINKSLRQIDSNTWLIGGLILYRSPCPSDGATWNDDGDHSSYTLTEAPIPLPPTTSPDSPYIKLVHEAGDASAVWSIGNSAFCKVRYIEEGITPESITLDFVQNQQPSFMTPKVIHHAFGNDRSYLFLRRLQGRTLDVAWPTLNTQWRLHYVNTVVDVCKEMAEWKGHRVGGVDNQNTPEYFLVTPRGSDNFNSVQAGCEAIGMDCSKPVFYHADLGPGNIIVEDEPTTGDIGIIDFEIAGYLPRGWIRTKFRLSPGMNLSASEHPTWWRAEVQKALGAHGFEDHADAWMRWRGYSAP
ncbi:hypothetical protein BU26DRAFT_526084 [Trematosphaeria pertusa]|uniref:Aminoglycoside phosphotransferase domain-containing protein n=1 Tax=Trematosphaeria pertusa TaxID=390896 RepID=A0A6A6HR82_9PLEO|nr:uncharacterized protein BU26DRAFT_526084 [Trematosphaeria pertusa]KAF2240342.1 hypothetical protein BU26DRAFT_526084 [Trematosphaeria pertusa]